MTKISHRLALEILNLINVDINLFVKVDNEYVGFELADDGVYIVFDKYVCENDYGSSNQCIVLGLHKYDIYMDKELDENGRPVFE